MQLNVATIFDSVGMQIPMKVLSLEGVVSRERSRQRLPIISLVDSRDIAIVSVDMVPALIALGAFRTIG